MKKFVIDSNVVFIATGQIGEAWCVVILDELAKRKFYGASTSFYLQEILEVYQELNVPLKAKRLFKNFHSLLDEVISITVDDFDRSYELFKQKPNQSPRDLINVAAAERSGFTEIFSVDGPRLDEFENVRGVSLDSLLRSLKLKGNYTEERLNNV